MKKGIVIFGCSRGIGKTLAISCKDIFSDIVLVDKDNLDDLEILFKNSSTKPHLIQGDILNFEFIKNKLTDISKEITLSCGVYLIRGRSGTNDFISTTPDDWDLDLNLGLKGAFFSAQTLFPLLNGAHKAFVTVSSVSAQLITHQSPGYHCAKAGIEQLTKYLSIYGKSYGVRVNCVRPGFIVQDEHKNKFNSSNNKNFREIAELIHPYKSTGSNLDIASIILQLCQSTSEFINGTIINVDGGLSIREQFDVALEVANFIKST